MFTGIASPGVGTLPVNAGGTGAITFTAGFIKSTGGTNALTSSSTVSLTSEVSGTLPVSNGGTGSTSLTSGALLVGNGTGSVASLSGGVVGYVPTWNGSTWVSAAPSASGVSSVTGSGITVSPTTGSVVVTLTGSNVTSALGTTPVQYATNVAASGTIASSVTATTQSTTDNSTFVATTAYVKNNLASYAQLSGATFSGNVIAPLHYAGTNTTNSSVLQPGSLNFWSTYTGNAYTSIAFNPSGSALSQQVYFFAFNNGGSAASNYAFIGDGTAQKLGGGTWSATSDERVKKNVRPLSGALDKILSLNPVEFDWKYDRPYEATVGFIAQEVEKVLSSAVREVKPNDEEKNFIPENEKIKTVGWQNDIFAYLIGAIKELKSEVDSLKAAK